MLTCYLTRRRLGAYLDGALDDSASRSTGRHLESCARCQREVDSLQRLRQLLRRNLSVAAEPDWTGFWPGIVRGIEDRRAAPLSRAERAGRPAWWQPKWALSVAVAMMLLVSVGVWRFMPGPQVSEAGVVVSSAGTEDPNATVMVYSTPERDVAVVWVFGLPPASQ